MPILQWDERYNVGVGEIDAQHRRLVAHLNELHDAMNAGHADAHLHAILGGLATYTAEHFATEERYMESIACPNLGEHRREHERLTRQVGNYRAKLETGEVAFTSELLDFLITWLLDHIQGMDQKMRPGVACE